MSEITYTTYTEESQMNELKSMIDLELSEPYSIFTYRYFIYNWPSLTILAYIETEMVGVIVCKLD